jgi:hypothetical protein
VWSALAPISFAVCFGSAVWVLSPHDFAFGFSGRTILAEGSSGQMKDLRSAYRTAGSWIEAHIDTNAQMLADLSTWLTLSCGALAAEVILGTIGIVR